MTIHISLDIETWGKRPGCDIRSIGAVVFDPVAGTVSDDTFYIATENPRGPGHVSDDGRVFPGLYRYPLRRDPETVKWWSDQSAEAQAAFENPVDLRDACLAFSTWFDLLAHNEGVHTEEIRIWANDPHFDVSILAEAYHSVGLPVPWHYRAPRSMKTATDLAGLTRDEYVTATVPHHALHDAIAQAQTICKCYERLGLV